MGWMLRQIVDEPGHEAHAEGHAEADTENGCHPLVVERAVEALLHTFGGPLGAARALRHKGGDFGSPRAELMLELGHAAPSKPSSPGPKACVRHGANSECCCWDRNCKLPYESPTSCHPSPLGRSRGRPAAGRPNSKAAHFSCLRLFRGGSTGSVCAKPRPRAAPSHR